jgi:hypothetical protein
MLLLTPSLGCPLLLAPLLPAVLLAPSVLHLADMPTLMLLPAASVLLLLLLLPLLEMSFSCSLSSAGHSCAKLRCCWYRCCPDSSRLRSLLQPAQMPG